MKTISSLFAAAALLAAPAVVQANNILIYKVVETSNDLYTDVDNPGVSGEKGYAAKTYVTTDTYYVVMDLATGTAVPNSSGNVVEVDLYSYSIPYAAYDSAGKSVGSKKLIFIPPASPLSDYFGPLQPLKLANNYLWSAQSGTNSKSGFDYDENNINESFDTYFASRHLKGVGTPLAVSKTLTLPNVPRSLAGKAVAADWYQVGVPDNGYPPYNEFSSNVVTKTWTLDTALTTGANTVAINRTADLGVVSSLAAGTVENGVQRVHNLVYAQGFRVAGQ